MAPGTGDQFQDAELVRLEKLKALADADNATLAAEVEAVKSGADLDDVEGSGVEGRITKADVKATGDDGAR